MSRGPDRLDCRDLGRAAVGATMGLYYELEPLMRSSGIGTRLLTVFDHRTGERVEVTCYRSQTDMGEQLIEELERLGWRLVRTEP